MHPVRNDTNSGKKRHLSRPMERAAIAASLSAREMCAPDSLSLSLYCLVKIIIQTVQALSCRQNPIQPSETQHLWSPTNPYTWLQRCEASGAFRASTSGPEAARMPWMDMMERHARQHSARQVCPRLPPCRVPPSRTALTLLSSEKTILCAACGGQVAHVLIHIMRQEGCGRGG